MWALWFIGGAIVGGAVVLVTLALDDRVVLKPKNNDQRDIRNPKATEARSMYGHKRRSFLEDHDDKE